MRFASLALATTSLVLLANSAPAADMAGRKGPEAAAESSLCKERTELVPDIFGFTSGSDVASFKSVGLGFEYGGAYGQRGGRFDSNLGKAQVSVGLLPCLEVGPEIFGSRDIFKSFDAVERDRASAFGGGVEVKLKLLGRAQHGFGLTLVAEPTIARVRERTITDDGTGAVITRRSFTETGLASKVLLDAVLVPERLFLAINLIHEVSWPDVTPSETSSTFTVSTAVSARLAETFYAGVEARYRHAYEGAWFDRALGDAWFLGPTMFWAITDKIAVSATWSTQVAGNAKADPVTGDPNPGRLNLVDFNHHEAKAKLAVSF